MSGVFESIVGGTRTPRQYGFVIGLSTDNLANRVAISHPTGANDKGKHSFKFVASARARAIPGSTALLRCSAPL